MNWSRSLAPVRPIALFMLLFDISGCKSRGRAPPDACLASSAAEHTGARLYAAQRGVFHGADGCGNGPRQSFMVPPPGDLTAPLWTRPRDADRTFAVIRGEVAGTAMMGWPALPDRQTWELVAYIGPPDRGV
jgi:hypothetical protein